MIYPRGTRVKSIQTNYKGVVMDFVDGLYIVNYDKLGIRKNQPPQCIEPLARALNYLRCLNPTVDDEAAVAYLLTPSAKLKLALEARNVDVDTAVRDQYKNITGIWLEEGNGYHVAPDSAKKQGCQGSMSFVVSAEHEVALSRLNMRKPGFIDNLSLLWLLVERGARITR